MQWWNFRVDMFYSILIIKCNAIVETIIPTNKYIFASPKFLLNQIFHYVKMILLKIYYLNLNHGARGFSVTLGIFREQMVRMPGPGSSEGELLLHKFYASTGTAFNSCSCQEFFKRNK